MAASKQRYLQGDAAKAQSEADARTTYPIVNPPSRGRKQRPESGIQASIIEALGLAPDFTIYRNNVGIAKHEDGSRVRYGLMPCLLYTSDAADD